MTHSEVWKMMQEAGGRDEYILSEMKRLGFWDTTSGIPQVNEELREKRRNLEGELRDALSKQKAYQNRKKMLREMRAKRMAEAKARRLETRERQRRERAERAAAWAAEKERDIRWLGPAVPPAALQNTESQTATLEAFGLPVFAGVAELAAAMNLTMNDLRFLAFDRRVSRVSHYRRFQLPKKTGGFREISAPAPRLKAAQHWILEHILYKMQQHEAAHGFVPERSIVSNARPHVGASVVINMDVKDFFPSVSYRRVKGLFRVLGYSEQLATVFALLCTEPQTEETLRDGQRYFVAKGERRLPQGAPTSPAITNILCWGLDRRFAGMAQKLGWAYTRYADDLTFSKKENDPRDVSRVLWQARQIVENEGFALHPQKIKVMRRGSRQEVTGVVVNEKPGIAREKMKHFRAVLHRIETQGLDAAHFGNGHILQTIQGFANYVLMVDPEKGAALKSRVQAILAKAGGAPVLSKTKNAGKAKTAASPVPAGKNTADALDWWRMF